MLNDPYHVRGIGRLPQYKAFRREDTKEDEERADAVSVETRQESSTVVELSTDDSSKTASIEVRQNEEAAFRNTYSGKAGEQDEVSEHDNKDAKRKAEDRLSAVFERGYNSSKRNHSEKTPEEAFRKSSKICRTSPGGVRGGKVRVHPF